MEDFKTMLESLHLENIVRKEDIPSIDLYMDQVTQLFEKKYASSKRHETDKILTKTMINNYAKGKLLFPIQNKKYTKEHIMLIQFIYHLKGALSINDVGTVLSELNHYVEQEEIELDPIYQQYTELMEKQVNQFNTAFDSLVDQSEQAVTEIPQENPEHIHQLFLIMSVAHYSNMYRKLAERLVDQLFKDMNNVSSTD
ncbi:DUF1836 domain-containing protein [Amphibacillus cookii]|uniref:DUF1836 domain-containing protein n=1 Tax=Amphibacillus cookii TaxID=767787 RepID=UPI00195DE160|nr:DUF1836 domain-containing protein [Amphibacillus cookii]MBM7540975.1 DNA-binding transcriptional MerR regulator [Amphibacillus cookii]